MSVLAISEYPELTKREIDVLLGILEEKTYSEISYDLGISAETVKSYQHRLREKLNVRSKVGLALWADRNINKIKR